MKAGWIGQIAGVSIGAPTEFKWQAAIIPEDAMPKWNPDMINNGYGDDDLYVEMTFLRSMDKYGLDVDIRQAGIDFAYSEYLLWHANNEGRNNLRKGIAPPDCSHPEYSVHADDIDYQIEADFSGLIAPGMPNTVIALGDKFGRLVNYGDGVYAGEFVGAMYAEAFFEKDVVKIIRKALEAIPEDSQYAEMVRDMLAWYGEIPGEWEKCWQKVEEKYHDNPGYRRVTCDPGKFNIDAKINGAYILMGLLYGNGDIDRTMEIATRCGQDSDCNPSNAAGVLFTTLGFSQLPARFSEKLDEKLHFNYSEYNFTQMLDVCEKLARQTVEAEGGRMETADDGKEYFVIPVKKPLLTPTMKSWEPLPVAGSLFTEDELAKMKFYNYVGKKIPGWKSKNLGELMYSGYRKEARGKSDVIITSPFSRETPSTIYREAEIPKDRKTALHLVVSTYEVWNWWNLTVRIDGDVKKIVRIDNDTVDKDGWKDILYDLTPYAGKKILIELENNNDGTCWSMGYWDTIELKIESY
jgi:hypothetical protein